jgi:hypothetical protein
MPEEKTVEMPLKEITKKALHIIEEREIERVLTRTPGNKSKASRLIEIDYKTPLQNQGISDKVWNGLHGEQSIVRGTAP